MSTSTNAFTLLGFDARPLLDAQEIVRRFDAAALTAHPDRGGAPGQFATLEEARQILTDPARRLRHLLEVAGVGPPPRGPGEVPAVIGEAFSRASRVCAMADAALARHAGATSALAKALVAPAMLSAREEVEQWLESLTDLRTAAESALEQFDAAWVAGDVPVEPLRDLAQIFAFVTRWTAQGRERLFALSEVA